MAITKWNDFRAAAAEIVSYILMRNSLGTWAGQARSGDIQNKDNNNTDNNKIYIC